MNRAFVYQIAKSELLLLGRNWAFRVYALLLVVGVFSFHVACQSTYGVYSWSMVALPSSIPLVNAFLFCLFQSFFIPFAVLDLWSRERGTATLDVIRVHPESNLEYLAGKFTGIGAGLALLGLVVMSAGMAVNGIASNAPFSFPVYTFYWFTLTLPSTVFMLALSFFIVFSLNNRWLSLLSLMIVFLLTATVLPGKRWDAFNFLATHQPNLFSPVMGHVDLKAYLLHRACFLFCGAGLFTLAVRFSRRLFNRLSSPRFLSRLGGILLLVGICFGWTRDKSFREEQRARERYRSVYLQHEEELLPRVKEHDIVFTNTGEELNLSSRLVVWNQTGKNLSRVVLYLNPFLKVKRVESGNKTVTFKREEQALVVDIPLPTGDSAVLSLDYSGKIDERVCYLDIPDKDYYNTSRFDAAFHWGRRYAYTGEEFTLLLPECIWYPVTIPPVNLSKAVPGVNFTRFHLRVKEAGKRTVLSQGVSRREGDDWCFDTGTPLEGISLCAGYYARKSARVKDFNVSINPYDRRKKEHVSNPFTIEMYHFKGHDFFSGVFTRLRHAEIEYLIEEEIGDRGEFEYPGDKLRFIETPLAFTSYFRAVKGKSELTQPGMVFYPEFGASLGRLYDFRYSVNRFAARRKPEQISVKRYEGNTVQGVVGYLLQLDIYHEDNDTFVNDLFCSSTPSSRGNEVSCHPLMKVPVGKVVSKDYPVVDLALKRTMQQIIRRKGGMNFNIPNKVRDYLENKSLEDALNEPGIDPHLLNSIIEQKGVVLGNYVCWHGVKFEDFYRYLRDYYRERPREIPLEELVADIKAELGVDLMTFLPGWYTARGLPCFLIKDIKHEVVREPFPRRTRTSLKVYNPSGQGGFLLLDDHLLSTDIFYIQPGECKAISVLGNGASVYFGLSQNKPGGYSRPSSSSTLRSPSLHTSDTTVGVHDISPEEFLDSRGEIIVDNEDPGFHLEGNSIGWLQRVLGREEIIPEEDYVARREGWTKWISSRLHGDVVRSAYYRQCGRGKFKAVWEAELPEPGIHEVQVYVAQEWIDHSDIDTHAEGTCYHYTVEDSEGKSEEIKIDISKEHRGWFSIGKFNLAGGKARVILDDRGASPKHFIVADAVKWVKK
ncbi:hypothetical protein [Butyricimonas sp. Marseille-P3923]|uniref:golvesin C-terminal-like domain-containing protein n=1 Tax=Butyricimonas sp. Marseille-P3923 TaxID=1987504 RepID=UPI000C06B543|nr:hypothetical protein [Butyricimonas sp. Marseille-P3923]